MFRIRQYILLFGDICVFYISLAFTLLVRYGAGDFFSLLEIHAAQFSFILFFWLVIFYIGGMYDIRLLQNSYDIVRRLGALTASGFIAAISWFYFFSDSITPKSNLFIFATIFFIIDTFWRVFFHISIQKPRRTVAVLGRGPDAEEFVSFLKMNPHIGYRVSFSCPIQDTERFSEEFSRRAIDVIIMQKGNEASTALPYVLSLKGACASEVKDFSDVFETLLKKTPLRSDGEYESIFFLSKEFRTYEAVKRFMDACAAVFFLVVLVPAFFIIASAIFFTSGSPVVYRQIRIGKNGNQFVMYKFRTMTRDAEKKGAQWASKYDGRTTRVGTLLRNTHLDELPQLFNIIQGVMSFVGPRPERPELVSEIRKHNPYYDARTCVLPGLTGWAQLNYGYEALFPDVREKLSYDLYYIRHRNIIFDILIFVKSIKMVLFSPEKERAISVLGFKRNRGARIC